MVRQFFSFGRSWVEIFRVICSGLGMGGMLKIWLQKKSSEPAILQKRIQQSFRIETLLSNAGQKTISA